MPIGAEAEAARLRGELLARLEELNHVRRSLARMQAGSARDAQRLESVHTERETLLRLRDRCRVLAVRLEEGRATAGREAARVAELEAENAALRLRCEGSERWLEAVRRSTSWRLTRPFRALLRRLLRPLGR